ncbi:hypothetical protein BDW72DRAFT_184747 [Aspergillus terricola var. indicus]
MLWSFAKDPSENVPDSLSQLALLLSFAILAFYVLTRGLFAVSISSGRSANFLSVVTVAALRPEDWPPMKGPW